jgi:hypothetical protein
MDRWSSSSEVGDAIANKPSGAWFKAVGNTGAVGIVIIAEVSPSLGIPRRKEDTRDLVGDRDWLDPSPGSLDSQVSTDEEPRVRAGVSSTTVMASPKLRSTSLPRSPFSSSSSRLPPL